LFGLWLCTVCVATAVSPLISGELRGKVVIAKTTVRNSTIVSRAIIQKYVRKSLRSYRTKRTNAGEPASVVIYIEDAPVLSAGNGLDTAVLDQTSERFVPHVLPVVVGAKVKFVNSDEVYHNVFSLSAVKSFDLGRYARGKFRTVKFDKPGVVKIYCDIHTHMNAFILVLKNPYFAQVDSGGEYVITGVPAGTYVLKAWHGRLPVKSHRVTVREKSTTYIDFTFP